MVHSHHLCLAHICSRFLPFAGPNRTHSARGLEVPENPIEHPIEHPIEYLIEYSIEHPIEYPEQPSSTRKRHEG